MSRIALISDLHLRLSWVNKFLATQEFDAIYYSGDVFDQFDDTPEEAILAAEWLKEQLHKPNHYFCQGNHDISYCFPNITEYRCSGFTREKCKAINSILTRDDWDKFKLCYEVDGYLISHAGAHPYIFTHPMNGINVDIIKEKCERALELSRSGIPSSVLGAGVDRGGENCFGGITWADWSTFEPITGISQITAHSRGREVRTKHIEGSENYCIDCDNKYIGIIQDGVFSYIKNEYL